MNIWQHLFVDDFEYAAPKDILAGLTLEHVGVRPREGVHSIYEELFHTAVWQRSMVASAAGGAPVTPDPDWPSQPTPPDQTSWNALVEDFLTASQEAAALGEQTQRHNEVLPEGRTVRERLELLAVHNAYHLDKIVLLRQLLGVWTPPPDDA